MIDFYADFIPSGPRKNKPGPNTVQAQEFIITQSYEPIPTAVNERNKTFKKKFDYYGTGVFKELKANPARSAAIELIDVYILTK